MERDATDAREVERDESEKSAFSDAVIYRCTVCGKTSVSVGWLHAHIETKHTGFGPFNIIPNPFAIGNFDNDMTMTEVLRIDETTAIDIEEVEEIQ